MTDGSCYPGPGGGGGDRDDPLDGGGGRAVQHEVVDRAVAVEGLARGGEPERDGPAVRAAAGALAHGLEHARAHRSVAGELQRGVEEVTVGGPAGQKGAAADPVG